MYVGMDLQNTARNFDLKGKFPPGRASVMVLAQAVNSMKTKLVLAFS
jgi:hypothetical protein